MRARGRMPSIVPLRPFRATIRSQVHAGTRHADRRVAGTRPADHLCRPCARHALRAPDLQEFRVFGCGGGVRADLRHFGRARLWHETPAGQPPAHDAENVAARRCALCRAHRHDDGGAGHLLRPPRSLPSGPSCCSRSTSSRSSARRPKRWSASSRSAIRSATTTSCRSMRCCCCWRRPSCFSPAAGRGWRSPFPGALWLVAGPVPDRAAQLSRAGLLVHQSAVVAIPVQHRHGRHDACPPRRHAFRSIAGWSGALRCSSWHRWCGCTARCGAGRRGWACPSC